MSSHAANVKPETSQAVSHSTPRRIKLVKNHNYVKNGRQSYAHALRKCKFRLTLGSIKH